MSQIITWWCLYLAETLLCIFFGNTFIYEGWLFTMKNELYDAINMSVLFSRKVIDNDTVLVCRADMVPLHEENLCGYQFALELRCHDSTERCEILDVTSEYETAQRLFDLICSNNVYPCHLRDVAEDFLAEPEKYN